MARTKQQKTETAPVTTNTETNTKVEVEVETKTVEPVVNDVMKEPLVEEVVKMMTKKDVSFDNEFDSMIDMLHTRRKEDFTSIKKLQKLKSRTSKQLNKLPKKKNKSNESRKATGFGEDSAVPPEFKKLLNIEEDKIRRTSISKLLHRYLKDNNLKDVKDKRIHRVNDEIQEAFDLTREQVETMNASTNSKDKDGFNFYNVQNYIKYVYDKNKMAEKVVGTVEVVTEPVKVVEAVTEPVKVVEEVKMVAVDEEKKVVVEETVKVKKNSRKK